MFIYIYINKFREMENNNRSAQSILLSTGSTHNNSSPPSHSLSRRASFTNSEVNSLKDEDTCI
jgi:hypothetical protein